MTRKKWMIVAGGGGLTAVLLCCCLVWILSSFLGSDLSDTPTVPDSPEGATGKLIVTNLTGADICEINIKSQGTSDPWSGNKLSSATLFAGDSAEIDDSLPITLYELRVVLCSGSVLNYIDVPVSPAVDSNYFMFGE